MKKKFIDKVEQLRDGIAKQEESIIPESWKEEVDKNLDEATWNLYKSRVNNDLPGKGGTTWKMKLDRNWFQAGDILNNGIQSYKVGSKVYTKWWQRIINKITFGLYKPTTFCIKLNL